MTEPVEFTPPIIDNQFRVDYDDFANGVYDWVVVGPAVYYRCLDKEDAYTLCAQLNGAYKLGCLHVLTQTRLQTPQTTQGEIYEEPTDGK